MKVHALILVVKVHALILIFVKGACGCYAFSDENLPYDLAAEFPCDLVADSRFDAIDRQRLRDAVVHSHSAVRRAYTDLAWSLSI